MKNVPKRNLVNLDPCFGGSGSGFLGPPPRDGLRLASADVVALLAGVDSVDTIGRASLGIVLTWPSKCSSSPWGGTSDFASLIWTCGNPFSRSVFASDPCIVACIQGYQVLGML